MKDKVIYRNNPSIVMLTVFAVIVASSWFIQPEYIPTTVCIIATVILLLSFVFIKVKASFEIDPSGSFFIMNSAGLVGLASKSQIDIGNIEKILVTNSTSRNTRTYMKDTTWIAYLSVRSEGYKYLFNNDLVKVKDFVTESRRIAGMLNVEVETIDECVVVGNDILKKNP